MGFAVSGVMMVKLLQVEIDADLPWLAMLFKGRIEAEIREWLSRLLS
ncbi:MAG TPA: polyhydroxyalkanoic acid system family protein [Nitrososphaera sp.]|nr:polyhydroxyalkanoic acid system family protein [Nitrososphaera sp.]